MIQYTKVARTKTPVESVQGMLQILVEAIQAKAVIEFEYEGQPRIVEPFCYGINTANHEALRAFQIGGYSSSGTPFGWRMYLLSKMQNWILSGAHFAGERPGDNPNDSKMVQIFCRI